MKKILLLCLLSCSALADVLPPPPASQAEVNAGVVKNKYVSPYTLANWNGSSNPDIGGGGSALVTATITNLYNSVPSTATNQVLSYTVTNDATLVLTYYQTLANPSACTKISNGQQLNTFVYWTDYVGPTNAALSSLFSGELHEYYEDTFVLNVKAGTTVTVTQEVIVVVCDGPSTNISYFVLGNAGSGGSGGGGGVSAAEVPAIMATNSALTATNWIWATNYTVNTTNRYLGEFTLSGAGTSAANGVWRTNHGAGTYTNANGCGFDFQFEGQLWITNTAGDYLYLSTGSPTSYGSYISWNSNNAPGGSGGAGTDPAPIGFWPTNTGTATSIAITATNTVRFNTGLQGNQLVFGSPNNEHWTGWRIYGTSPLDYDLYPSATIACLETSMRGLNSANISCYQVTNYGLRMAMVASGHVTGWATNAQYFVGATEFSDINNEDGVAATIGSGRIYDYGDTIYTILGSSHLTNKNSEYTVIAAANSYANGGAYNYVQAHRSFLGGNNITNAVVDHAFAWGNKYVVTNGSDYALIGNNHRAVNATNFFLLGDGLTTTSNNVMKLGFAGWHLLIQTNTLQLISNGIPYNITRAP